MAKFAIGYDYQACSLTLYLFSQMENEKFLSSISVVKLPTNKVLFASKLYLQQKTK